MFTQMYYYAGPWRAMGWEERTEKGVYVRGTMTDNIQSKLAMWIDTSAIDSEGSVDIAHDCSYHAVSNPFDSLNYSVHSYLEW